MMLVFSIARTGDYAEQFIKGGFIASYKIKEGISDRMSGGIAMYGADGHKVLGVDVGLHDISYGIKHYNLRFTEVDAFTVLWLYP